MDSYSVGDIMADLMWYIIMFMIARFIWNFMRDRA